MHQHDQRHAAKLSQALIEWLVDPVVLCWVKDAAVDVISKAVEADCSWAVVLMRANREEIDCGGVAGNRWRNAHRFHLFYRRADAITDALPGIDGCIVRYRVVEPN